MRTPLAFISLLLFLPAAALAQPAGGPPGPATTFTLEGGAVHQALADLEGDGEFRASRLRIQPGVDVFFSREFQASFSVGYSLDRYDFSGSDGLAGAEPFEDVRTLSFSAFARHVLDEDWTLFGGPSLRLAAETGADLTDGASFGVLAGATWKASETLSIGPGLGFFTEIEDSGVVFPFLLIDWAFADGWSIGTGRAIGATRGPGLTLAWEFADRWSLGLGARWEQLRFRLDDDPVSPDGVGEEESIPVVLALSFEPAERSRISLFAGMAFRGRMSVLDDRGKKLLREDYDPAPFLGVAFSLRF